MQHRIRTKICGITRQADLDLAAELGADAIGLVFHPPSKRAIDAVQAAALCARLPAFVSVVGLFVNPTASAVQSVLDAVPTLDCLQFHGDESAEFCESFHRPYMKAFRVRDDLDVVAAIQAYPTASAILLDSYDPRLAGGTGHSFDWRIARQCVERGDNRIVLAGGLNADNAEKAIREVRPWALDVSSGVESEPGVKSAERMTAFFKEVYRVQSAG